MRRWLARPTIRRERGQAVVEFALTFPIFLALLLAAIQFGVLLLWYGDEVRLTHEAVRWLAVHPDTADAGVAAQIRTMLLPTMVGDVPAYQGLQAGSDVLNDHDAQVVWQVGRLEARFTPCGADPTAAPPCSHVDRSPDGGVVSLELRYDASNVFFVPHHLSLPFMELDLPTQLPGYRAWLTTE